MSNACGLESKEIGEWQCKIHRFHAKDSAILNISVAQSSYLVQEFWQNNSPPMSVHPLTIKSEFCSLWLLAFTKAIIAVEREEILNYEQD